MSDQDFGGRDSHLEALEKLNNEVGQKPAAPHRGGYLSADEYATLIYYWAGEEHEPGLIDGVIAALANQSWAWAPDRALQTAGALKAFSELFPEKVLGWAAGNPGLFAMCNLAYSNTPAGDPAWNRYHLVQWFILRRAHKDEGIDILDKLLDRVAEGGTVGCEARETIMIAARDCKPFEVAMDRAQRARAAMMVIG